MSSVRTRYPAPSKREGLRRDAPPLVAFRARGVRVVVQLWSKSAAGVARVKCSYVLVGGGDGAQPAGLAEVGDPGRGRRGEGQAGHLGGEEVGRHVRVALGHVRARVAKE